MAIRNYVVHYKRGLVNVSVADSVIALRGERKAVLEAAWRKLMGLDDLGQVAKKHEPTRKMLQTEIGSRYAHQRPDVYDTFCATVKITWVGVSHG